MTDLPPEIILQIYTNLPTASSITALNHTSHYLYNIWTENASSISGAVLSKSIPHYDSLSEIIELGPKEGERYTLWSSWSNDAIMEFLTNAQTRARKLVASAHEKGYQELSSNQVSLREVGEKNQRILHMARLAAHLCTLYQKAAEDERTTTGEDSGKLTLRGEILDAYYGIWMLTILLKYPFRMKLLREVVFLLENRVKALSETAIKAMLSVTRFLLYDSSGDDRRSLEIDIWDQQPGLLAEELVCKFDDLHGAASLFKFNCRWAYAFWVVIVVSGDENLSGLWPWWYDGS